MPTGIPRTIPSYPAIFKPTSAVLQWARFSWTFRGCTAGQERVGVWEDPGPDPTAGEPPAALLGKHQGQVGYRHARKMDMRMDRCRQRDPAEPEFRTNIVRARRITVDPRLANHRHIDGLGPRRRAPLFRRFPRPRWLGYGTADGLLQCPRWKRPYKACPLSRARSKPRCLFLPSVCRCPRPV